MAQNPGFTYGDFTGVPSEILASTVGVVYKSVMIDAQARDQGQIGGAFATYDLRKGLIMAKGVTGTAAANYVQFNTTDHGTIVDAMADTVILAENIFSINKGAQIATVIIAGTLKGSKVLSPETFFLTNTEYGNARWNIDPDQ